ncbi:MAG: hypothetical protein JRI56_13015 [Deltaproteobacteria bacterium]|nr:hypothetical protein [Deltaproteobacteria bacterium]
MAWADIAGRRFRERPAVVGIRDVPPECTVHYDPRLWGSERMICGCDIPPEYIDPVWARGYPVGVDTPFLKCSDIDGLVDGLDGERGVAVEE